MTHKQFCSELKRWLRRVALAGVLAAAAVVCARLHKWVHSELEGMFTGSWTFCATWIQALTTLVFMAIYVVLLFDTAAIFIPPLSRFKDRIGM
jgi:hypothetical protein